MHIDCVNCLFNSWETAETTIKASYPNSCV